MKHWYLILLLLFSYSSKAQLYLHDFGTTAISAHPYTVPPSTAHSSISASSWTNSTGLWTSFAGSSGQAIALNNSSGSPTITLTFNIAAGFKANITSFEFWRQRSSTGAQNWSMTINGIAVGSGTAPTSGTTTGVIPVSNAVNNLSGTVTVIISLSGASGGGTFRLDDFTLNGTIASNAFVLLDHFNRPDTIRPGIPSSGGLAHWEELETGFCTNLLSTIRIQNNAMVLAACNSAGTSCLINTTKTASMQMTGKYPTVFANSSGIMEWYFNMQQSRTDPDGFSSGQHGVAFVIGSNTNDPLVPDKKGYAVVMGETGTTDPVRLVAFTNGFSAANFTNIIDVPSPVTKTNYMSIRVSFNPCNDEWSLTVRDDGATAFADPITITDPPATATNNLHTSENLFWMGTVWAHTSSCSMARFDNVYIPNSATGTGSYAWDGSAGTDFQDPYNWTPVRECVRTTDKLVFNSSSPVTSTLTNVPDQTIAQLLITNNRTVTLNDNTDGAVNTLSIAGAAGTDLQIDNGSTLILSVSSSTAGGVVINVNSGATGSISGNVFFNSPFAAKAHRLLAADASGIVVNSGGVIRSNNLSGNPFGSTVPQNTIVFNAGSAYEYLSGANPFGLTQPQSKVVFNTGSTYRHISNNAPSIPGRVYADFELQGVLSLNSGSSPFTVDNLNIVSGSLTIVAPAAINTIVKRDLNISAGTSFTYATSVAAVLEFSGSTVAQHINNEGIFSANEQLTIRVNSSFATAPQVTVEDSIHIRGVLDIVQGTLHLNDHIRLVSSATATASVAPVTGNITYGSGRFIVERFIPNHTKAWQFLAAPASGQTVKAAWQEGAATPLANPVSGYGTIITGHQPDAVTTRGFDIYTPAGPSMKTYDAVTNTWIGIDNTNIPISNPNGYMLMVRGDRSVTASAQPATALTLRTTGIIHSPTNPPPVYNVLPNKFASIGNPYPSAIDFSTVTLTGDVQDLFYVWDPKLTGIWGLGAYQTFVRSGGTYTVTPGGGSYSGTNRMIESGLAFLVKSDGATGGTVTIGENSKVAGSNLVTRGGGEAVASLRTQLYVVNNDIPELVDGNLIEFDNEFSNLKDALDAIKILNTGENLGLKSSDATLVVERRSPVVHSDTFFYIFSGARQKTYQLHFIPELIQTELQAYLIDNYLGKKQSISLINETIITFEVNGDPASASSSRFQLVFRDGGNITIPVTSSDIRVVPNPVVSDNIGISFTDIPAGKYHIQLYGATGQLIISNSIFHTGGTNRYEISSKLLASGIYLLKIIQPDGKIKSLQIRRI